MSDNEEAQLPTGQTGKGLDVALAFLLGQVGVVDLHGLWGVGYVCRRRC